jgi:hypothetical protein
LPGNLRSSRSDKKARVELLAHKPQQRGTDSEETMATKEKVAPSRCLPEDVAATWYTLDEAMQRTKRSRSFLYRRSTKKNPVFKRGNYGSQVTFSRVSVDNFVARHAKG